VHGAEVEGLLNVIVLIGRLTRDPELRYTPQGTAVCRFTLAVDRPFTNQQGERETDFIDVECWRQEAERVAHHLSKGAAAAVQGRLQIRSFETQEGQRRRVAEVVAQTVRFLDRGRREPAEPGLAKGQPPPPVSSATEFADEPGEDVPF
jgi:single-strand DNA-binding protein